MGTYVSKKDIEEIKSIINDSVKNKESVLKKGIASLIISIISSFIATFLTTSILSNKNIPWLVYVVIVVAVVIVSIIPFFKDIYRKMCRKEIYKKDETAAQVNLFDNDIIYNIMLANKYFDLYGKSDISINEKEFYISETKYFIRKIVRQMQSITIASLCDKIEECNYGRNKKILRERVESALNFVIYILKRIDENTYSKPIENDINGIITSLGLKKDAIYK